MVLPPHASEQAHGKQVVPCFGSRRTSSHLLDGHVAREIAALTLNDRNLDVVVPDALWWGVLIGKQHGVVTATAGKDRGLSD